MQTENFLTIGEVSKISGVHVKSLRYYDKIGVLKPVYVDPNTSYRYYTYQQLSVVQAIKVCIELDIPLNQFSNYTVDDGQKIRYALLLEHGKALAEKKIRTIREGIKQIEIYQRKMGFAEILQSEHQNIIRQIAKKRYYVEALDKKSVDSKDYYTLDNLYFEAAEKGFTLGYEFGLIYIYKNNEIQRFRAMEIIKGNGKSQQFLTVPAGQYMSKCVTQGKIETAATEFPELFTDSNEKIVLELELFSKDYNILKPLYELRCSASAINECSR